MRVLFTCGREAEYVRNDVILRALRKRYEVIEITDRRPGSLTARNVRLLPRLLASILRNNYDLIFVGFYGYFMVPWLRLVTQRPIIFDAFVSNYDTLCFDRKKFRPESLAGRLAFHLDRLACRSADLVLLDTAAQRAYFAETFNLPHHKLNHVYVSCNEDMFQPLEAPQPGGHFTVLSYSSYLPLHGVEYIVNSAKILQGQPGIQIRLIGHGQTFPAVRQLADRLQVDNIELAPPVPYQQLPLEISRADLCLAGPFGRTDKARRVVPGKLFQFLAMARPTIAAETPANKELLIHRRSSFLIPPANAEALAAAITAIKDDDTLRESLAVGGYNCYQQQASEKAVGGKLYQIIEETAQKRGIRDK